MGAPFNPKKVTFILGTRPEAIKLSPLIRQFMEYDIDVKIINTSQHPELTEQILRFFELKSSFKFPIFQRSKGSFLSNWVSECLTHLNKYFEEISEKPDAIIVQGDTSTAFIGAYFGFLNSIKILHVEAGLRTYQLEAPFPEEGHRQLISRIAYMNFAPTLAASRNLKLEGIIEDKILVTGNTVIDAINWSLSKDENREYISNFIYSYFAKKVVLVTCHRRENFGEGIENVFRAILELARRLPDIHFIIVKHPNPAVSNSIRKIFSDFSPKNLALVNPLSYAELQFLLRRSQFVITDSGGLQEEAPSFQIKTIVTRNSTERVEGIQSGHLILCGTDYLKIVEKGLELAHSPKPTNSNPFGDGKASQKIIEWFNDNIN